MQSRYTEALILIYQFSQSDFWTMPRADLLVSK